VCSVTRPSLDELKGPGKNVFAGATLFASEHSSIRRCIQSQAAFLSERRQLSSNFTQNRPGLLVTSIKLSLRILKKLLLEAEAVHKPNATTLLIKTLA
jgi:hypothetical protein